MGASEEALAGSYRLIGDKRRAAETHAYFATRKEADMESSLNAAIGFLDINEEALSRKHFENAVAISKADLLRYENQRGIFIYNHAEVLLMAEKPEQMLKLFADEAPKVSGYKPASRDYLIAVASLMINPDDYHSIRKNYINSIAKHGKLTEWDYDTFNRWLAAAKRSVKEKRHLQELEMLNK